MKGVRPSPSSITDLSFSRSKRDQKPRNQRTCQVFDFWEFWNQKYPENAENAEEQKRLKQKEEFRNEAAPLAARAMRGTSEPVQQRIVETMTNRAVDGQNSVRTRMPNPPKFGKWGGRFLTDRDAQYCPCGRLKTEHSEATAKAGPCSAIYDNGELRK